MVNFILAYLFLGIIFGLAYVIAFKDVIRKQGLVLVAEGDLTVTEVEYYLPYAQGFFAFVLIFIWLPHATVSAIKFLWRTFK